MAKCECCGQELPQKTPERFDEFWAVYPNRVKKKAAMRTWRSRKLDKLADVIIENIRTRIDSDPRWEAGFIPDPTTFLNGDRWEDEIETVQNVMQWPTKNEDWAALGVKHNILAGAGEGWPQYKDRIRRHLGN